MGVLLAAVNKVEGLTRHNLVVKKGLKDSKDLRVFPKPLDCAVSLKLVFDSFA